MAGAYSWYIMGCMCLFISMQFHWYGKPSYYALHNNKNTQTNYLFSQLSDVTHQLHTTVNKVILLKTDLQTKQIKKNKTTT